VTNQTDPQDPLPESNFLYRRLTTWFIVMALLALVWHNVEALHGLGAVDGLVEITKWLIALAGIVSTYYLIAPSAEQVVRIIQTARVLRQGIRSAENTEETPTPAPPPVVPVDPPADDLPEYAR
jgi:hypothetical protein